MNTNRFALIYGIVFLIVGVAGFIPASPRRTRIPK